MTKKLIIGAGLLAGMLLLSGCGQPSPNGGLVSIHGKSYNMPSNTVWYRAPFKPIEAVYLANNGMNCRGGSVVWFDSSLKNKIPNSINGMSDFAIKMHKQGKSGCSNPLSDKQYTYILRQQNQQNANARANTQTQQQSVSSYSTPSYSTPSYSSTNRNSSNGYYKAPTYKGGYNSAYQLGGSGSNYYRSGGNTYNVRQLGGSNLYKVREVKSKTPTWNWVN